MRSAREFLHMADALRSTAEPAKTLRVITDAAARMTVSTQATLRLHNPESGLLLLGDRTGDAMHTGGAGRFSSAADRSALGWCAERKDALIIDDPRNDPRFVVREGQTWMPSGLMAAPLLERDQVLGVVSVARPEGGWPYTEHDLDTLRLIAELAAPYIQIDRLTELAERDQLTGLSNRHHLAALLPRLQERAIRCGEPLSGILLDLDHFGKVNTKHGWHVGDVALQRAAAVLRENVRVVDSVVRAGGEEFLILLPSKCASEAIATAKRLCREIRTASFDATKGRVNITASLGAGPIHPGDTLAAVLERLGVAVRKAKEEGRNRAETVVVHGSTWKTFFDHTRVDWRAVHAEPDREPDYESASGSRYWNAHDGVYRASDHWKPDISGCHWLLDGGVYEQPAVGYAAYGAFRRSRADAGGAA